MNTDRNLLFGVLALQSDLIDSKQFVEACATWAARKNASLADILVERGWITPGDKADVDRVLQRKLKRHGGNVRATLGAVADFTLRDAIRDLADPELRESLDSLAPTIGHVRVKELAEPAEQRSRYKLSRLHGKGGLGQVWVAVDGDLNREVALKELKPEQAQYTQAWRRFMREAQVTGQLEHPNIVPIYELSRRPDDGQPFYTMRFVRGQTLRNAIAEYHRRRHEGQADPLELRRLLQDLLCVCNAIAYAHSRGVLHRDLKPSNVVLGAFGEVILLDWGLARLISQETDEGEDTKDMPVAVTGLADSEVTATGRTLGTPMYMAPEQAEGKRDLIDSRTDIYGLGSILFQILTGRAPHHGDNTEELLKHIIGDDSPRPRAVEQTVPAALDAICAKAMAKSRADRYATANDLANDLQRWLADEPVSVYREPLSARVARWARRHRAWTQAAAAALLAVTVVSGAAAALINRARQQSESARLAEAEARAEATELFREARTAVDTHLTEISEALRHYPGVQRAREIWLRRAADDYERFARLDSDNPELQVESGWAFVRLGDVRLTLGELQRAVQAYRSAEAVFDTLARAAPDDADLVMKRSNCRTKLGIVLKELGQYADADQSYRQAIAELETLERKHPASPDCGDSLATALVDRALLLRALGQPQPAGDLLNAAAHKLGRLAEAHPSNRRLRFALATARLHVGHLLGETGDNRQAVTIIGEAIGDFQSLVQEDPDHPDYLQALADCRIELAKALRVLGRDREEKEAYETAIADYRDLLKVLPDVPDYRENVALAQVDLAQLLHFLGHNSEARTVAESALAEFQELAVGHARVVPYRYRFQQELAAAHSILGQVLSDLGRQSDAETQLHSAVRIYRDLTDEFPIPEYRHGLAVSLSHLGQMLHKRAQDDAANEAHNEAIEHLSSVSQSKASLPVYRDALAWCYVRLGDLLRDMTRPEEAEQAYRQALWMREELAGEFSEPEYLHNLGWLLANCTVPELRDPAKAVAAATRALDVTPQSSTYWNTLGAAYYRVGDWDEAIKALHQAERLRSSSHALDWLFLAMAHWQKAERKEARSYYDRASRWMQENMPGNMQFTAIRDEAKVLLAQPEQ